MGGSAGRGGSWSAGQGLDPEGGGGDLTRRAGSLGGEGGAWLFGPAGRDQKGP